MKIAAGIVTYNPDIKKLEKNIKSIFGQSDSIVICDNGSDNIVQVEKIAFHYKTKIIKFVFLSINDFICISNI